MIEKISPIDHIRMRPGMYIGIPNQYGILEVLGYLIEDFFKAGIDEIHFSLKDDNQLIIEGFGQKSLLLLSNTLKNVDSHFSKNCPFSLIEILALSESSEMTVNDNGNHYGIRSDKGKLKELISVSQERCNSIKIDYIPDKEIFKDLCLNYEILNHLFRRYSFLNPEIKIKSVNGSKKDQQVNIFHFPNGVSEIIDYELEKRFLYYSPFFKLDFQKETEFSYAVALLFFNNFYEAFKIKTYANYKEATLGGSLLDGIMQGFQKFFKEEARKKNKRISVRSAKLKQHLFLYASVTGELTFLGATRQKLGTPLVQKESKEFVYQELKAYFADKDDELIEALRIFEITAEE